MNFLSGVKPKSVLGRKLSNRYLSRDAFTSSKRTGGRGIRRLGSVFKTRRSLFEIKFTVMKIFVLVFLLILVIYTIPTFRFMIHSNLVEYILTDEQKAMYSTGVEGEIFIAPKYLSTDTFIVHDADIVEIAEGSLVEDVLSGYPVGILVKDEKPRIRLFSDPEFKNNLFIKVKNPVKQNKDAETTSSSTVVELADAQEDKGMDTYSFDATVFTGGGYGELIAKLPPQEGNIKAGDMIYIQTVRGLRPVAVVSRISDEDSSGSTFSFVYAQLLASPQKLYKVKFINE